jgi:hypothetical protein
MQKFCKKVNGQNDPILLISSAIPDSEGHKKPKDWLKRLKALGQRRSWHGLIWLIWCKRKTSLVSDAISDYFRTSTRIVAKSVR